RLARTGPLPGHRHRTAVAVRRIAPTRHPLAGRTDPAMSRTSGLDHRGPARTLRRARGSLGAEQARHTRFAGRRRAGPQRLSRRARSTGYADHPATPRRPHRPTTRRQALVPGTRRAAPSHGKQARPSAPILIGPGFPSRKAPRFRLWSTATLWIPFVDNGDAA